MAFTNFNPPFTNQTIDDFFEYPSDYQDLFVKLREYIVTTYPEIELIMAYHVPYFVINGKKLFYFHYVKNETGELSGEISFAQGDQITDTYKLFSEKNTKTKAIHLDKIKDDFSILNHYIQTAIRLRR